MQDIEHYVVECSKMRALLRGCDYHSLHFLKDDTGIKVFALTAGKIGYILDGDWLRGEHIYGLLPPHEETYCDGTDQDHHDVFFLMLMLVRAIGIPIRRYYREQLILGLSAKSCDSSVYRHFVKHSALAEKQVLRLVMQFLDSF